MATCTIRVHYPDPAARLGLRTQLDWSHDASGEPTHNESAWSGRVHLPFQWFFGRTPGTV